VSELHVEAGGLRVAYRRAGQGPPLVLLHGILADSRVWRPQLDSLPDAFDVIAWDAPGTGGSGDPGAGFGMEDWADCLAEFLVRLDAAPAHVLGLSWGGVLAQELYARHPERVLSLILCDTYAGWKGSLAPELVAERLAGCEREAGLPPSEFLPAWLPGLLRREAPPDVRDEMERVMSDFHPAGYLQMGRAVAASDTRELLPRIAVPTLLLWGEEDARSPLGVARQLEEAIPGAELAVIPDCGHVSNLDQPARFDAEVRRFLARLA